MSSFRVLLRGRLPSVPIEGEARPAGFFVTRAVKATNAKEAGAEAIRLVQRESKYLELSRLYAGQAAEIEVDEAVAAEGLDTDSVNRTGYVFFDD